MDPHRHLVNPRFQHAGERTRSKKTLRVNSSRRRVQKKAHEAPHIVKQPKKHKYDSNAEPIVGLDIGEKQSTATMLRFKRHGAIQLSRAALVEYEPNSTPSDIASAIRRLWTRNRIRNYTVCASLCNSSVIFKNFKYEDLDMKDFKSTLWLDAENALQRPASDIAMDFHLSRKTAKNAKTTGIKQGFFTAAPAEDVNRVLDILEMAELYPVALETRCSSVCNLFLALYPEAINKSPVCLIHIDHHDANMAILRDGDCLYARNIVSHTTDWNSVIKYFTENIKDILDAYQFSISEEPIEKIILTGYIPSINILAGECQSLTGITTALWDPMRDLKISGRTQRKIEERKQSPLFVASLGLALRRKK